jgi:polyisoprenyl-phosphate glycosyltransferase
MIRLHLSGGAFAHQRERSETGEVNHMQLVSGSLAADTPELSVVVPFFNEQENVAEVYRRLAKTLPPIVRDFELVFVNDGSRDATTSILEDLHNKDARVTAIHLSRNFGHQAAISAGILHARGQCVAVMDGDLQDPPEVLPDFVRAWRAGYDVAYAVRTQRKEGLLKRAAYHTFYRLLALISDIDIPMDSGDFCVMDRKVVGALNGLPERTRFVRGLRTFVGYKQIGLQYERDARAAGRPKYTFRALMRLAVDGLVSFSTYPLRLSVYAGFVTALLALLLTVWILIDAVSRRTAPRGWASTLVIVIFMGSIQLISVGIIGEYISRIFVEAKQRPSFVIARIQRRASNDAAVVDSQFG